jgi:hypothetical protein
MSNHLIVLCIVLSAAFIGLLAKAGYRFYTQLVAAETEKHENQGSH